MTLTRRMALSPEQQQQQYINYLRANGHSKEATAYWIAVRDGDMLQEQYDRVGIYLGGISYRKMERLFVAWCTNCISISGAMFSLVLGGIFQLVHRFSPHLQKSEPLQKSAKWGVTLGLALPAILIMASVISPNAITLKLKLHSDDVFKIGIGIGFMVLTISPFLFRLSWREVGHGLLVILATLASLVVLHKAGTVGSILMCGVANVLGFSLSFSTGEPRADTWRDLVPYLPYLMVFPIPGILLLLFGTISRILRIPLAAGITRGMSAVGAPLACVLALIWAVTLLQTLRLENAAIVKMERMIAVGERKQLETIFRYQQNLRR